MGVVAVIPSRGRPDRAWLAARELQKRAVQVATKVLIVVDEDDESLDEYIAGQNGDIFYRAEIGLITLSRDFTGNLVKATNTISLRIAREDPHAIIGNLGDDHVCRTEGWDKMVASALTSPGIAYGDDLAFGEALPTAPFMSAEIVNALGWYALPTCEHLYIDDVWRELGRALGRLHYLPDLIIEHQHADFGKAENDAGYDRARSTLAHDKAAYDEWLAKYMDDDVRAVLAALEGS